MKKQIIILPILLAFVLLFPIDVSAVSYFSDEMISFGRDAAQESVQAEDGFVLIPGGTFQMGSPAGEPERSLDEILIIWYLVQKSKGENLIRIFL